MIEDSIGAKIFILLLLLSPLAIFFMLWSIHDQIAATNALIAIEAEQLHAIARLLEHR